MINIVFTGLDELQARLDEMLEKLYAGLLVKSQ